MLLHEAILQVINQSDAPMSALEITRQIDADNLHLKSDNSKLSSNQVWARVHAYPQFFEILPDKTIIVKGSKSDREKAIVRQIRNRLIHSPSPDVLSIIYVVSIICQYLSKKRLIRPELEISNSWRENCLDLLERYGLSVDSCRRINDAFKSIAEQEILLVLHEISEISAVTNHLSAQEFLNLVDELVRDLIYEPKSGHANHSPAPVTKFISGLINISEGQTLLDPYGGIGHLSASLALRYGIHDVWATEFNPLKKLWGELIYIIVGLNPEHFVFQGQVDSEQKQSKKFDWIVSGLLGHFTTEYRLKDLENNDHIVLKLTKLLKTDGRAVFIVPSGFLYNHDRKSVEARRALLGLNLLSSVISLPTGTYHPYSGTSTSMLILQKGRQQDKVTFTDLSGMDWEQVSYISTRIYDQINEQKQSSNSISVPITELIEAGYPEKGFVPGNVILQYSLSDYRAKGYKTLGQLVRLQIPGKNVPVSNLNDEGEGAPYLRISDLPDGDRGLRIVNRPKKSISDIDLISETGELITRGNVVLAKVGAKLKPGVYDLDQPALPSNNIFALAVDERIINPDYLATELNADYVRIQLKAIQKGASGPPYYRIEDLLNLFINVPPKQEQLFALEQMSSYALTNEAELQYPSGGSSNKRKEQKTTIKINEQEIIASIQHRISQYISPIANDINNFRDYYNQKIAEGVIAQDDRISKRENSATIAHVFDRIEKNLSGVAQTFDVMRAVLYFDKGKKDFERLNLRKLAQDAQHSIAAKVGAVKFFFKKEKGMSDKDLIIPVAKDQIVELIRNFIINSIKHGFTQAIAEPPAILIYFKRSISGDILEVHLINNGQPLPDDFSITDFTSFGRKGNSSIGTGVGGYLMNKIAENHDGMLSLDNDSLQRFNINEDGREHAISANVHFILSLPYAT